MCEGASVIGSGRVAAFREGEDPAVARAPPDVLSLAARRGAAVLLSVSLLGWALLPVVWPASSRANGWEHGAIPFEALLQALNHESPEMRGRAAESLGFRGQPEAVEPLLKVLERPEGSHEARRSIYMALGRLEDTRALPALGRCLDQEEREELRASCVVALGEIGDPRSLPALLTAFHADESPLVQSRVVEALGSFPQPASIALLSDLVSEGGDGALRLRAIRALGATGARAASRPLLAALDEAGGEAELSAIAEALGRLRDPAAVEPLTDRLARSESARLRTHIVMALAATGDASAYGTLVDMLSDEVPAVRYFAVVGLKDLGRKEAARPLAKLYFKSARRFESDVLPDSDRDPLAAVADISLQVEALRALIELDAEAGLPALLDAAKPRQTRRDSQAALKVAEGIYELRRIAIFGLGYTRSDEAARLLAGAAGIGDPDARLRAAAVRSLGVLGFAGVAEQIVPLLEDPAPEVRWTAAMVLGRLADRRAVSALLARLTDANGEVRKQAALALGYLGDAAAQEPVERLARGDESEKVRTAASYAASLLASPE